MANSTHTGYSPSTPYILHPLPPLLPFISDLHLLLILPTVAYWTYGLLFFWIECNGYLAKYRLHTPTEVSKRNRVPMSEVIYSILFYQLMTTLLGLWLMRGAAPDTFGSEEFDVSSWATRIRSLRSSFKYLVPSLSDTTSHEAILGNIALEEESFVQTHSSWERVLAWVIYHYGIPMLRFSFAILLGDTWQYLEHRIVHMNQYLYSELTSHFFFFFFFFFFYFFFFL